MTDNKLVRKSWAWVLVAIFAVLFLFLLNKTVFLDKQLKKLTKTQAIIIQNQTRLQAVTQLLTPNQIKKLTQRALWGDVSAMDDLYIYYNTTKHYTDKNKVNALVWGTLRLTYSQYNNKCTELLNNYKKVLSDKNFKLAKKEIILYKEKISQNLGFLFNYNDTIPNVTKSLFHHVKNCLSRVW